MAIELVPPPPIPGWIEASYPFPRRVAVVDGRRIHLVDAGQGPPVVWLVHGNPTWSFLWRKVIARLLAAAARVVAPDLLGFGLSDKPRRVADHSLGLHFDLLERLVAGLDLREMTIVGQDWGGVMVAEVAARVPERVRAAVFAHGPIVLPEGGWRTSTFHRLSHVPLLSTAAFRGFGLPVRFMHWLQGDPRSLGPLERRAYAYPLRRWRDRAAPLALARLVPDMDSHPSAAALRRCERWARTFAGPVALVWGLRDPILGSFLEPMRRALPRARVVATEAGHFLQEEVPDDLAQAILDVSLAAPHRSGKGAEEACPPQPRTAERRPPSPPRGDGGTSSP